MYKLPSGQVDLAKLQAEILEKWKNEGSFKASIKNLEGNNEFVFYDGPPFANGLPHYGHLLTSYIKDSVARFQTMIGNKTERRFGWDCHGLPAEMETEKELKLSGRTQIMEYGIEKFNESCRLSVMKYSKQWQEYIEKAGRWVDFAEDYRTMDKSYMESVLWGFKKLYEKGLLYEDFRVMPYSWKCETPLSNFETRMDNSYRSHTSKAATVIFKLKDAPKALSDFEVYLSVWTTTPWTLPSNLAIAVNKKIEYVALKIGENGAVIISKNLASKYEKEFGKNVILELKGAELLGFSYNPIFEFFSNFPNAFKIIHGDFVEDEGGTGIVHIAPGFGEDDWLASKEAGIKILCPVDDAGKFTSDLYPYVNFETKRLKFRYVKKEDMPFAIKLFEGFEEMQFANNFEFFESHLKEFGVAPMVAILKETGEEVGIAGLISHDPSKKINQENAEVLGFFKPEFQEKGLGSEAFKFFAKYAFARFEAKSVIAVVLGKNPKSSGMLVGIGFENSGEVLDPRSNLKIQKYTLHKFPNHFKTKNLEFKKEDELYAIYNSGKEIGKASIQNKMLDYQFSKETEESLIFEGLNEVLERFAFTEIFTKNPANSVLKNLGFFETKQEDIKILKRNSEVLTLAGRQVFESNDDIIAFLKHTGTLVKQEQYIHNYPHCWRTDTPLIYKAVSSWYVEVTKIKDRMVELNKSINWLPSHIRDGQFGKWLENARDWSITRNRFWGTPVPVWKVVNKKTGEEISNKSYSKITVKQFLKQVANEKSLEEKHFSGNIKNSFWNITLESEGEGKRFFPTLQDLENSDISKDIPFNISFKRNYVFGSVQELNEFFKSNVQDLHRPFIDELVKDDFIEGFEIRRVTDVLDCWFESGSMPFASVHYPFENKDWFESHNPADFIVEYVAQTRGWFYTLMVLGTALFDKAPFKTCLCHGVILDSNGQKLSKRLRNYPDPLEVFETYGSDAMRFFLLSSPVVTGGDLNISKDGNEIRDVVRLVIKPIWNAYTFFAMYANADKITAKYSFKSGNIMDKYIFSKLQILADEVKVDLARYDFPSACLKIQGFIDTLNNWYIRRSKERFWKEVVDEDKLSAYNTLYTVLSNFAKIIAPILPFTAEAIFTHL